MSGKFIDLTGQKFGRLTVVEHVNSEQNTKNRSAKWLCLCECGNYKIVCSKSLKNGDTKSCGCYKKELNRQRMISRNMTHGHSNERLHFVWRGIKKRCYNPNHVEYKNYGGRGIKLCKEWHDYSVFREWAYSNGYDENAERGKCTIERIDNDKDYCPENCKFASMKEQANNKSSNRYISYNNKTQTVAQWADELNIRQETLRRRMQRGWSIERTLSTP